MKYFRRDLHKGLVIKSWCENPEQGALEQAYNLAELPFAFKHVALMPDTHQGYGMPIGGVLAADGYIIPNAVGVDIGCGVVAVKSNLHINDLSEDTIKKIISNVKKEIPVGKNHHKIAQPIKYIPDNYTNYDIVGGEGFNKIAKQVGTLGGGNHFWELQKDSNGFIWIMIHSGSRNLGKKVADYYNKIAVDLNEWYYSRVPKEWQLAFFPFYSKKGQLYYEEMSYCVEFAKCNRELMIYRSMNILKQHTQCTFETPIDVAHNYARLENHFGKNVVIHRKGATSAKLDEIGIIPGSQGTCSYIVKGKGNPDSFTSCSHGAGRQMGRKEACRSLNLEDEIEKLNRQGIIHSIRTVNDLEEAAGAYKNIDTVIKEQKDLVDVVEKLQPIAIIKG